MPEANLGAGVVAAGMWTACVIVGAGTNVLRGLWKPDAKSPDLDGDARWSLARCVFRVGLGVLLSAVAFHFGWWTAASVGFSSRVWPPIAFGVGALAYFVVGAAYSALLPRLAANAEREAASLRSTARALPRNRRVRCVVAVVTCLTNPVCAEIFLRGMLVHQWALLAGHVWGALALGAVVNGLAYAHQGWRSTVFRFVFYATAVALLYSPLGMTAAIGLHFSSDALSFFSFGARVRAYRATRKEARRAVAG